ncbi:MAG: polysaccharide biosynthesis protein [Clostridia bacterium]|nr:polysaccharide biosynthesis protein [Clostridia bacterium]
MKKKSFLYGAVLLTLSALLSKVFGAIYRIPLTNLLGTEGMGIYQLIFPVYALLLVISSSGIPVAISRLVSEQVAINKKDNTKKILKSALMLTFCIGLLSSSIVFFASSYISNLQGNSLAGVGYLGAAPAILLGSMVAAFRGYFEGLQDMQPTALSEIIEQIAKVALGLLLANYLLPMGIEYGVLGAILGITLGEIVSLITIIIIYKVKNKKSLQNLKKEEIIKIDESLYIDKQDYSKLSNFKIAKIIFLKSLPITLSATIIPLTLFIDSILIINLLTGVGFSVSVATSLFGIQTGVVNSLITLPMIIAIAISTAILPSIVASNTLKNAEEINFKTSLAIKIVWIISLPCFIGFLLLATDITSVLYSGGLNSGQFDEIAVASSLIKIVAVSIIYHSFLRIFTSILHALNKSFTVVKHLILASVVKIALTVLLVSSQAFNIYGASVASAVSYAIACLLTLISLKKFISVTFSFKTFVINPLIASIFLVATILLGKKILSNFLSEAYATLITIGLSAIVYIVAIGVLKVFNKDELNYIPFFKKIKKLFTKKVRL